MNETELDERLRSLDRMDRVRVPGEVLDRVVADVRSRGGGFRRRRAAIIASVAALGLGAVAVAPAAADVVREWLAVADWQPEAGGEILPDSEWVDLSAPDLPEYIASRYPEWLPLPPGSSREQLIADVVDQWTSAPEVGLTQEVGIRHSFELTAYCGWLGAWLDSDDPADRDETNRVLAEAAEWPAMVATDGDIIVEIMAEVARQAALDDREAVLFSAQLNGCSTADGGDHSAWFQERQEFFDALRENG